MEKKDKCKTTVQHTWLLIQYCLYPKCLLIKLIKIDLV